MTPQSGLCSPLPDPGLLRPDVDAGRHRGSEVSHPSTTEKGQPCKPNSPPSRWPRRWRSLRVGRRIRPTLECPPIAQDTLVSNVVMYATVWDARGERGARSGRAPEDDAYETPTRILNSGSAIGISRTLSLPLTLWSTRASVTFSRHIYPSCRKPLYGHVSATRPPEATLPPGHWSTPTRPLESRPEAIARQTGPV
jgi:hypothetical protein